MVTALKCKPAFNRITLWAADASLLNTKLRVRVGAESQSFAMYPFQ